MKRMRAVTLAALALLAVTACVSRPRPTAEAVRRLTNPPAVVQGRVRDPEGRPVAGVSVQGLPREKHLTWSPPATTDAEGRFRLTLVAPGDYGFLVEREGVIVVTGRADDPARVVVSLRPAESRDGIELLFRPDDWEKALRAPANARPPR